MRSKAEIEYDEAMDRCCYRYAEEIAIAEMASRDLGMKEVYEWSDRLWRARRMIERNTALSKVQKETKE